MMRQRRNPAPATAGDFDPFAGGGLLGTGPTTEAQREILAVSRMGPEAALAYNEGLHLSFRGPLDPEALEDGLRLLVRRHEALRTTFSTEDDAFFVWEQGLELRRISVAPGEADATLGDLLEAATREPFDPYEGPLFRAALVQAGPDRWELVLVAHHLICDGWSYAVLIRELADLYRARAAGLAAELPEAPAFSRYAAREQERAAGGEDAREVEFWRRLFQGSIPALDLPLDRTRPPFLTFRSARVGAELEAADLSALRRTAASLETSLFGILLAGFYAFLSRLCSQNDLVVAVPASGQASSGMMGLVGHCVNALPLRVVVDPSEPFSLLAAKVASRLQEAFDHQDFTLGRLMSAVNVPRDPARRPVASVMFNLDRPFHRELRGFTGVEVSARSVPRISEYFELFLNLVEEPGGVALECQYAADLFDEGTVEEWLASYLTLLRGVISDAARPVSHLEWVPPRTLEALSSEWQGPRMERPPVPSVAALIEARARATPDAVAVRWRGGELRYGDLLDRAAGLSRGLRERGVREGDLVGVWLSRGGTLPLGLLGLLGSGASYLPLDRRDPAERLRMVLEDAAPAALLVDAESGASAAALDPAGAIPILHLEELALPGPGSFPTLEGDPAELVAYVIYTSGSTGVPKGVRIPHAAVLNFLLAMAEVLAVESDVVIPALTTLSFDISVLELLLPLVVGGTTAVIDEESARDPRKLSDDLANFGVTLMQATPSAWSALVDSGWTGRPGLRALAGGELLPPRLAGQLLERVAELWNMYGPTETTVWSACHRVSPGDDPVPLGRPVANTVIHVLDGRGRPVPAGVPGAIVIGGAGVAAGYLNRPELTAERFVPGPPGGSRGRFYRTGDVGRWGCDGRLRFLGRTDDQVKIRGHRVELGEVEAALLLHPGVRAAAAALQDGAEGDPRLVACFEPADRGTAPSARELREHLCERLPEYMIPSHLIDVDRIPRSPAGKVDRKSLPRPSWDGSEPSPRASAPATDEARFVAEVWSQVLGVPEVFLEDDFFEMGGHSILAVKVVTRVDHHFGTDVGLRALFEAPRLGDFLARVLAARTAAEDQWEEILI